MAHEIETMAYTGETPWHKLGTRVDGLMTAHEALVQAGLDWDVNMEPIYLKEGNKFVKHEQFRAIVRATDREVYNVVKDQYTPIQNSDSFQFFDQVIGTGEAKYETAGSLRKGALTWILCRMKDSYGINGDEMLPYILLVNAHDASLACQMFNTDVRAVCANTVKLALNTSKAERVYVRHTRRAPERIYEAREILGLSQQVRNEFMEQAKRMASLQLKAPDVPLMLKAAFMVPMELQMDAVSTVTKKRMAEVEALIETGTGLQSKKLRGSRWAGYNAVVEWVDHQRMPNREPEKRANSAFFGSGDQMKQRTWDWLVAKK